MPMIPLGGKRILTPVLGRSWQRAAASWSPTDIAGCKLWVDFSDATTLFTDAGTTPVSADGQAIYQANDKSGSGHTLTQSTEGYRPLYKVNIKNSLSAAQLDGSDDFMQFASNTSTIKTMFTVTFNTPYVSGTNTYYSAMGATPFTTEWGLPLFLIGSGGSYVYWYLKSGYRTGAKYPVGGYVITSWVLESAAAKAYVNGQIDINYADTFSGGHLNFIGKSTGRYLKGYILEEIGYDTALSDANRILVQNYLNAKWAIY